MILAKFRFLWMIPSFVRPWQFSPLPLIETIDVNDFDVGKYYESRTSRPLLISNVLSPQECEKCSDTLFSQCQDLVVDLQNQLVDEKLTEIFETSFADALDAILYESDSQNAYTIFCEGLLDEVGELQDLQERLLTAKESLFPDDVDWFKHYFPPEIQPSDAVILSGAGATSTLHRDPYEWMGTSLCIEGSKVWRFIDPGNNVENIDTKLESYRLESIAWEGSPLSAGWQSTLSLFDKRQHEHLLTAKEWFEREEVLSREQKLQELQEVACNMELLSPSTIEPFRSLAITTTIQEAGDLLLIPAHWWHQTYGLEPSAAIASQRCGKNECEKVIQHILNHNKIIGTTAEKILDGSTVPSEALNKVFHLLGDKKPTIKK